MNMWTLSDIRERTVHRIRLPVRFLDLRRRATAFSRQQGDNALQRIYVINLDRKVDRWRRMRLELDRFRERHGAPLTSVTRRFSAVDARYMEGESDSTTVDPIYTLADQLLVHPNPLLAINDLTRTHEVHMTPQEIAVARSHVQVWRLIAEGDVPSALVLEDDVFMPYGFTRDLEVTWGALNLGAESHQLDFDLLYLAYREVGEFTRQRGSLPRRRQRPGIWEASGYVLTRTGAQKLLERLPVRGPVDLWLNLQFKDLTVYTSARRIIEQRIDEPSTNSYSILPVLSQVGAITREKPLVPRARHLIGPVIGMGKSGSGLSALATALAMVGYTCIADVDLLPRDERQRLLAGNSNRIFNAYVNASSFSEDEIQLILARNRKARLIITGLGDQLTGVNANRLLRLTPDIKDKWAALSDFLDLEYPTFKYPCSTDIGQRHVVPRADRETLHAVKFLRSDRTPWIVGSPKARWDGIRLAQDNAGGREALIAGWDAGHELKSIDWKLRNDTFPSNLAIFKPSNFVNDACGTAKLILQKENTSVRDFTSAAIASQQSYLYGTFSAILRPPRVTGLITGIFLHRNGPRQEIDIEFLGRDTSKMLVNVYYNPGPEGTKLEYGYRGTPALIDLDFDAADALHTYEIVWRPHSIIWRVDGT